MIKIEYSCDKCGKCEPYMPSKAGGIIICMKCRHQENIPKPTPIGDIHATYTEWYKYKYGNEWTEQHAIMFSIVEEYEKYCRAYKLEPIWNG